MAVFKEGDRVRIVARDQTEEDIKSQMYYTHYSNLTGTVLKVYNKAEVSIEVEGESLTKDIRKRHDDVRDQMKTKWLDGLSEEGRTKLTEREKDFMLRYVVLVSMEDLEKAGPKPVTAAAPPIAAKATPSESPAVAEPVAQEPAAEEPTAEELTEEDIAGASARKTLADIEAAEEEEFRRRSEAK
jgi:ribosomal protein L21E